MLAAEIFGTEEFHYWINAQSPDLQDAIHANVARTAWDGSDYFPPAIYDNFYAWYDSRPGRNGNGFTYIADRVVERGSARQTRTDLQILK